MDGGNRYKPWGQSISMCPAVSRQEKQRTSATEDFGRTATILAGELGALQRKKTLSDSLEKIQDGRSPRSGDRQFNWVRSKGTGDGTTIA